MNHTEMKKLCITYNSGFDEIEQIVMDWGRDNKALQKDIKAILSLDTNPRYPEGYGGMSAGNYLVSLVLSDPETGEKLYKKHEAVLSAKTKGVFSFWLKHPAFWCFFSIREKLGGDFLTIVDLLSGEEHLLYSPGICDMQKKQDSRGRHYLCLMLGNEECLQTAGILRFNSLGVSDFQFYCSLFEPEGDLSSIINKHYAKFFMLDEISTLPVVMHRGNEMLYTWQALTLEDFSIDLLGGKWTIKEDGNHISYSLEDPDESMMDVPHGELLASDFPGMSFTLYRDTKTGSMGINTTALASYTIIASLLARSYPSLVLPKGPEVAISMALASLLSRMDLDLPWSKFQAIMDYKEEAKVPESADMAKLNKLLQAYMQAQNTGKSFDAKAYSKKSGLELDIVEDVIQSIQNSFTKNMPSYEVSPEDKVYELTGWPVPPPATRRLFSDSIVDSDLFEFDEGPTTLSAFEALTGGIYKDEIFDSGLPEFIEILFLDYFDDYRFVCMLENTFLWILFYKGKEWLPVRSYAIEMLKLFPHPITKAYHDPEDFISDFSNFTRKFLCTRGICALKARPKASEVTTGLYAIKGSDAFYSLVEGINAPD